MHYFYSVFLLFILLLLMAGQGQGQGIHGYTQIYIYIYIYYIQKHDYIYTYIYYIIYIYIYIDIYIDIIYIYIYVCSIVVIIFRDFLMFYQIFYSPQVKQSMIISNNHGIYKLLQELLSDLSLRILRNQEIPGKFLNFIELQASAQPSLQNIQCSGQSSFRNKNFVYTRAKLLENGNLTFFVVCYIT